MFSTTRSLVERRVLGCLSKNPVKNSYLIRGFAQGASPVSAALHQRAHTIMSESKKRKMSSSSQDTAVSSIPSCFLDNKAFATQPAPQFSEDALLADGTFGKVSLDDFKGKYLVLFFYPLDWTFVCPTEIVEFSDNAAEFKKLGCEVVGASIDSQFSHHAWTKTSRKDGGVGKLDIPLIADIKKTMAKDYGCLIEDGVTLRGLFIIDDKGVIRHITKNDPPVGRNIDEVLRLVQGYQFTDKHGEVCPMNWRPGKKTIKTNPTDKLEYFKSV